MVKKFVSILHNKLNLRNLIIVFSDTIDSWIVLLFFCLKKSYLKLFQTMFIMESKEGIVRHSTEDCLFNLTFASANNVTTHAVRIIFRPYLKWLSNRFLSSDAAWKLTKSVAFLKVVLWFENGV